MLPRPRGAPSLMLLRPPPRFPALAQEAAWMPPAGLAPVSLEAMTQDRWPTTWIRYPALFLLLSLRLHFTGEDAEEEAQAPHLPRSVGELRFESR